MYCTVYEVRSRMTPGGNGVGTASERAGLTDEQITESIQQGDATIDSYLSARYTINTTPQVNPDDDTDIQEVAVDPVHRFSIALGIYHATLDFRRNLDLTDNDPAVRRYKTIMDILTAVRDGKATLPLPPAGSTDPETPPGGTASVYNLYNGHLWDAALLLTPERASRWPTR